MSKLFIIGNGFDLAHGIPSKYEDFRQYLISTLTKETGENYCNYDFTVDNGIITIDYIENLRNNILTIMYFLSNAEEENLIKNVEEEEKGLWRNVEESVGKFNYDDFSWLYVDESKYDKEERANFINENIFSPYVDVLKSIPNFFSRWINQISINEVYKKNIDGQLSSLFDDETKFLCFNYTDTLEYLYNIKRKNICYIHGKAKDNNILYFGHGNCLDYQYFINRKDINELSTAEGENMVNYALRKPVEVVLNKNSLFFESIKDVDEVYSFGFSYGSVDEPYIKKVIDNIPTNAKWMINKFPSPKEKQDYKNVIKKCGYSGIVKEF
ncbi:hypothetical protein JCM1393_00590 [Clostridium carnis]